MSAIPDQSQLLATWVPRLKSHGHVYEKCVEMHARRMETGGSIETVIRGEVETVNTYHAGDFIVHGTQGERYVMAPENFASRYFVDEPKPSSDSILSREGFELFRPKGKIWALQLTTTDVATWFPGGNFTAPWGAEMIINAQDFLATPYPAANEVYRIEETAFCTSYRRCESLPA